MVAYIADHRLRLYHLHPSKRITNYLARQLSRIYVACKKNQV